MLKRVTNVNEEIVEILLGNNFVLEALHFSIQHLQITRTLARKILEAAVKSDELLSSTTSNQKILFFTVYTFFEEYFQRTSTISAVTQLTNNNEQSFAYILALILTALLIFFAIWHVSFISFYLKNT
jgi:hypothetical protein